MSCVRDRSSGQAHCGAATEGRLASSVLRARWPISAATEGRRYRGPTVRSGGRLWPPIAAAVLLIVLSVSAGAAAGDTFPVLLARYATEYDAALAGRAWNIALAAKRLDGQVLAPGQELSFNDRVGARGLEDGFRVAPELLGGERVEGVGGGVCQVASTLYSAALDAGLTIVARAPHSRPAPYLPAGRDAMVAADRGVDLVLRNDLGTPVLLRGAAGHGRLTFELRGAARTPTFTVALESRLDPASKRLIVRTLRRGAAGAAAGGASVELLATDSYLP